MKQTLLSQRSPLRLSLRSGFFLGAIAGLGFVIDPQPLRANPALPMIFNAPPPPTDQGSPRGRSQGGASRGSCQKYEALTALVPTVQESVGGLTTIAHPTFWFYLPSSLTAETSIEFVLQDATDQEIYSTLFKAPDTQPGLISLSVPTTAPPLEIGKSYSWTLVLYCNPAKPSDSVYVQGTVTRTLSSPEQQTQLAAATPLEQARLYAAAGIWYEALTTLAELQRSQPNQAQTTAAWTELLQQVNLESLKAQPISPCCQF
ncbi:MAG: DUF928 domain-containing protein [Leptolyngbyaceae cyanobacterium CSU_1_4]|nr:DUF928 domain-containing protein [Leptolyngbyaceae cyanobacterium CSU_1_4]